MIGMFVVSKHWFWGTWPRPMIWIRKSYDSLSISLRVFCFQLLSCCRAGTFVVSTIEGHAMVLYMGGRKFCASLALFLLTYLFFRCFFFVYQWQCHNDEFVFFHKVAFFLFWMNSICSLWMKGRKPTDVFIPEVFHALWKHIVLSM